MTLPDLVQEEQFGRQQCVLNTWWRKFQGSLAYGSDIGIVRDRMKTGHGDQGHDGTDHKSLYWVDLTK